MPIEFLDNLGHVVITPKALSALAKTPDDVLAYLFRHASGDYPVLEEYDDDEEEIVRVLSVDRLTSGEPLWISTDRIGKTTTVFLPEEYRDLPM